MPARPDFYHSALHLPMAAPRLERWEWEGNVALRHDLVAEPELPADYAGCDVIYCEPPWKDGFGKFNQRAGVVDSRTYEDLLQVMTALVARETRPTVVLAGKHAVGSYPVPDQMVETDLYGGRVFALVYRTQVPKRLPTTLQLIRYLAVTYHRVGDPMCGYGVTGRIFTQLGKHWTLSDYNASCIGRISQTAPSWRPR